MTDIENLRRFFTEAVPFNRHLGIELVELGRGTARALLPDDPRLTNHVGTQHAAGLFSVAEAASGAAVLGLFAERLGGAMPLVRRAEVSYRRPATGPIVATAIVENAEAVLAEFDASGRAHFDVPVRLSDGTDHRVAEVTVSWVVRRATQN